MASHTPACGDPDCIFCGKHDWPKEGVIQHLSKACSEYQEELRRLYEYERRARLLVDAINRVGDWDESTRVGQAIEYLEGAERSGSPRHTTAKEMLERHKTASPVIQKILNAAAESEAEDGA